MGRDKTNLVKFNMFLLRACPLPGSGIRAWQIQKLETPDIFVFQEGQCCGKGDTAWGAQKGMLKSS